MKKNFPVTNEENPVQPGDVLISRTDLKGRITYASPDFARISDFPVEEMVGKAHNIIRHPEVPPAVFQDLWETVQAGRTWNNVVKNRARNGNFYWVEATVSPVYEKGAIAGYVSVRKAATEKQRMAAAALYAKIWKNDKKATALLRHGPTLWQRALIPGLLIAFAGIIPALNQLLPLSYPFWHPVAHVMPFVLSLLGLFGFFLIGSRLRRDIGASTRRMQQILSGQVYSASEMRGDEVSCAELRLGGNVCRSLAINLWGLLYQIQKSTESWKGIAEDLSQSASQMREWTADQAAASEEASAAVTQMDENISSINESAGRQIEDLKKVSAALSGFSATMEGMHRLAGSLSGAAQSTDVQASEGSQRVTQTARSMERIEASSAQIGSIIKTITGISERVNLLSLNASIESARAGEMGRGFAVVAEEISRLAEQTASSVKEIAGHLEHTAAEVESGTAQVKDLVGLFESIRSGVGQINRLSSEALQEMEEGNQQIQSVDGLAGEVAQFARSIGSHVQDQKKGARELSTSVSAIAAKSEELSGQSDSLHEFAGRVAGGASTLFNLTDHFQVDPGTPRRD
ncbi:MAG: PAS domain-containing protein [Leptospiraceae bacterium]|nr:PAS domain-containing protein [Leptospiraceae bacterium]